MSFVSKFVSGVVALGVGFSSVSNPAHAEGGARANGSSGSSVSSNITKYPIAPLRAGGASKKDQEPPLSDDFYSGGYEKYERDFKGYLELLGCPVGDRFTSGTYVKACVWGLGRDLK